MNWTEESIFFPKRMLVATDFDLSENDLSGCLFCLELLLMYGFPFHIGWRTSSCNLSRAKLRITKMSKLRKITSEKKGNLSFKSNVILLNIEKCKIFVVNKEQVNV